MGALCEGSFGHSRQCLIYIEQLDVDLDNAEAPEPLGMFVDGCARRRLIAENIDAASFARLFILRLDFPNESGFFIDRTRKTLHRLVQLIAKRALKLKIELH